MPYGYVALGYHPAYLTATSGQKTKTTLQGKDLFLPQPLSHSLDVISVKSLHSIINYKLASQTAGYS